MDPSHGAILFLLTGEKLPLLALQVALIGHGLNLAKINLFSLDLLLREEKEWSLGSVKPEGG